MPLTQLVLVVLAAMIGGAMNSIAGGGTLLTFPALIALGVPPIVANATSTVALWPGALGSMWGYRAELRGARPWAMGFAVPSLLGGLVGAYLLIGTSEARFSALVPWLVLGATFLFMIQRPVMRWIRERTLAAAAGGSPALETDATITSRWPPPSVLVFQFLVAIYGGYFGAGVGILMLAALGFMGLGNIHRMNGLKNWGGVCMNAVAAGMFAFSSLVNWPVALAMAIGAVSGGYLGSRAAQRVPQALVRGAVVAIGLVSGVLLYVSR
ncbi:MAG: sulfite exporter TauE/SafE family protein [Gemmatimonadaceae bacterium]